MLRAAGSDIGRKRPRAEAAATAVAPCQQMQWFEGDSGSEDEDSGSTGPSSNTNSTRGSSEREGSVEQECIELLSDDEDFDEDVDVIDILSTDLEDDDVLLVGEVHPADATPAPKRPRHAVLDLCGSQVKTYLEDAPTQREQYNMYIDGSYRQDWPEDLSMSAGGFCLNRQGHWFNFSCLLLGGAPNSTRAELGAIYVGCVRLLEAIQERKIDTASSEVHMHTDCQGAANVLKRKGARMANSRNNYAHIITGIKGLLKQLKALMPVRLKWVKGHQTGACDHKRGNDEAHRRAQTNSLMGCEPLPAGDPAPDKAAVAAAWREFKKVRSAGPPARHNSRPASKKQRRKASAAAVGLQQLLLQHKQMKKKGKKGRQAEKKQTAAQKAAARLTVAEAGLLAGAAARLQQLQQQALLQQPPPPQQQQKQQQAWVQPPPPPQRQAQQQQQWPPRLSPPPQQQRAGCAPYFLPSTAQAAQQPGLFGPRPQAPPRPPAAAAWQQPPPPLGRAAAAAAAAVAQPQAPTVQHIVVMVPVGVAMPVAPQQQQAQPPAPAAACAPLPPLLALSFLHGEAQAAAVSAAAAVALPGSPVQRGKPLASHPAAAAPKSPVAVICIDC